jgi:sulfate transport system substrate-binding protein
MGIKTLIAVAGLAVLAAGAWWVAARQQPAAGTELLNVSYDPTRELWQDLNRQFVADYEKHTGTRLTIKQSHGGSSSQARAVIDGLDADVVTLALWSDTDAIRRKGLIKDGWEERLPHRSLPYFSTIVFVVRKGNPKGIKDWSDLVSGDAKVITPDPKTSGNGRLSFLAAWGAVLAGGGTEEQARAYVAELYRRVPVLDSGARGATITFAQKEIGDVHLTWENEARLEVEESGGKLEIVYPSASIRAEPFVALVDANVDRKGTRVPAEAYLEFLYTEEAQETIARHHYRPIDEKVLRRHARELPEINLFPVTSVAGGWHETQARFFAEGAVFDQIDGPRK